jgi:hypothetical protein
MPPSSIVISNFSILLFRYFPRNRAGPECIGGSHLYCTSDTISALTLDMLGSLIIDLS